MTCRLLLTCTLCCAALAGPAGAQSGRPDVAQELRLFESTERDLDPLGLDESTGKGLDEAARKLAAARAAQSRPAPPAATRGEVLGGIEAVSESVHEVEIKLDQGLAFVRARMRFESRLAQPAEVTYRLPLPEGAAPSALRVCQAARKGEPATAGRCFAAQPLALAELSRTRPASAGPSLSAIPIRDARGRALALRAAPIAKDAPLLVEVEYVAPAAVRGGVARFTLPARGYDPRAAPSRVSVSAATLRALSPDGAVERDPWLPVAVRGELAQQHSASSTSARCGGAPCKRSFEASMPAPAAARETWLWLDASPSMQGPARNRADPVLSALLAGLPEQTRLRAFAFAARAQELGQYQAGAAPLRVLSDALAADLGAATQPRALYTSTKADLTRTQPRLLLLSDGKLDRAALHDLQSARAHGAELWLLQLGDGTSPTQDFDGVLELARLADQAVASGELEPLDEALRTLLGPRAAPGQRRGEQRVREAAPRRPYRPLPAEGWLSFWLAREHPLAFQSAAQPAPGVIAAIPFESAAPPAPPADTGMPKESVLSMLRDQLVPQARACLRTDRKGRADYAVGLTFHALFAEREAYDVGVEGKIPDALRSCLAQVVERLRIPPFSGRIRVRYPIHTEREPEAPVIELEPEAAQGVERVIRNQ